MKNTHEISNTLQRFIDSGDITGGSLIIRNKDEVLLDFSVGYADNVRTRKVDENTIYRLASMTKPITAIAIMMLIERGLLNLNDKMTKFLPTYAKHPQCAKIVISHLLSHCSGLGQDMAGMFAAEDMSSLDDRLQDRVDRWADLQPDFAPGEKTGYSPCVAFDILGRIVEILSDMELNQFLSKELFEPLEIKDIGFTLNEEQKTRLSVITHHDIRLPPGMRMPNFDVVDASFNNYFSGSAGLYGSRKAYDSIVRLLTNEGIVEGTRLLKPATIQAMRTENPVCEWEMDKGQRWGLGMCVFGGPTISNIMVAPGSYGWSGAFGTHFFIDPSAQMSVLLMLNADHLGGAASPISRAIENAVWEYSS